MQIFSSVPLGGISDETGVAKMAKDVKGDLGSPPFF